MNIRYLRDREAPEVRRSPGSFHPRAAVLRRLTTLLEAEFRAAKADGGRAALDLGCGAAPYRALVEAAGFDYMGADIIGNPVADVVVDESGRTALPDGAVSLVLSTQVLEHVRVPQGYLGEAKRLLQPDGQLVLSTHGIWRYHPDPEDFWRWTGEGLCLEVEKAGFEVVSFHAVLGLASAGVMLLQDAVLDRVRLRPARACVAGAAQLAIEAIEVLTSGRGKRRDAMVFVLRAKRREDR
jgi:SAM-dependent methyltransferase